MGILKRKPKGETRTRDVEICVCCGAETEYGKETPIAERFGYIEGAGQLCRGCFREVYGKSQSLGGNGKVY